MQYEQVATRMQPAVIRISSRAILGMQLILRKVKLYLKVLGLLDRQNNGNVEV